MIKAVTFTNRFGRSLRCVLSAPERSNFAITSINGLGPGAATVNIHEIVTSDGGYFGAARFSSRNIVVDFVLVDHDGDGNYIPIEKTRHLSYEFFSPKTKLQLLIETEDRSLLIQGYVESNEPSIFQSQVSMTVSILCPGYYFKMVNNGDDVQIVKVYGTGLFEFPFSNESLKTDLEPAQKLIQFGASEDEEVYSLYYDGDADNGFLLTVFFNGSPVTGSIIITNEPVGKTGMGDVGFIPLDGHDDVLEWSDTSITDSYITINIDTLASRLASVYSDPIYSSGNVIEICTETGKKSAKFITGNNEYNILGYLDHLDWLKLYPGYNNIHVVCNPASASHFNATMEFECLYSGV